MRRLLLVLALVLGAVNALPAQDQEAEAEPSAAARSDSTATPQEAPEEQASSSPAREDERASTAAPASRPRTGETQSTPQRFEPSEKVRADFDVSFPVDI